MAGLKQRIATGLALAVAIIAAAVWLPLPWLAALLHLFALVAAYEWAKLAGITSRLGWLLYAAALTAIAVALWLVQWVWPLVHGVAVLFWLAALAVVWAYPRSTGLMRRRSVALAAGLIAIASAWLALVALRHCGGSAMLLWLLVATSLADIGAYFAGRGFGQRKLAPLVSPNKTWEGLLGGAVATLAWGAGAALWFDSWLWLLAAALVLAAAVVGDLFESVLKRVRGAKESGGILPGHGGLLDRIDSVLAAAPVFALLLPVLPGGTIATG